MGGGSAKIKKKIRDIERLLRRDNIGADTRLENERALKALKVELEEAHARLNEREMAKKYHMVRFFERKKALRKLKQATKDLKKLEDDNAEKKELKKARRVLKHAQIDMAYVLLFPKNEKYLSLYPNANESSEAQTNPKAKKGAQETEEARRNRRKEMETLIDEDKLPFTFDDVLAGTEINTTLAPAAKKVKEIDAPDADGNDDDEDDFFE